MSHPHTPTAILDAKGAFIVNPQRRRPGEPKSHRPLSKTPPKFLSLPEKKVWKELYKQIIPGVVFESDRLLFTLLVRLATKLYNNEHLLGTEMSTLISLGARFAMTPADRSRVVVEQQKTSKLDQFIRSNKVSPPAKAVPPVVMPAAPAPADATEVVN